MWELLPPEPEGGPDTRSFDPDDIPFARRLRGPADPWCLPCGAPSSAILNTNHSHLMIFLQAVRAGVPLLRPLARSQRAFILMSRPLASDPMPALVSEQRPTAASRTVGDVPLLACIARDELGGLGRAVLVGGVLAVHAALGWALWQVEAVQKAIVEAAPTMFSMVTPEPPTSAPIPPPPMKQTRREPAPLPKPLIAAEPEPEPVPEPVPMVAPPPEAAPSPVVPDPAPVALPVPQPPPPPPAPPAPRQVPPGAVRYLVMPRMEVPLMSRRLHESGVVHLRIVVDVNGRLKSAVVSKSSGFARLDEQALQDIRSARFSPQTENGLPIEWQTIAPLEYLIE